MAISSGKKILILICGLIENLVFSGIIFGWPALFYMLKSEGIYEDLCEFSETNQQITANSNHSSYNNYSLSAENSLLSNDYSNSSHANNSYFQEYSTVINTKFNGIKVSLIKVLENYE
jgi:hypothetical protein